MAVKTYKATDRTQLTEHFNVQEFRCKCGSDHDILIDDNLPAYLEKLFSALDLSAITINSGHRCAAHDKAVGGSGTGFHVFGQAADICCINKSGVLVSSKIVSCAAQSIGFGGIANIDSSYHNTHVDVRHVGHWYGDEVVTTARSVTDDFFKYYGVEKEEKPMKSGIDVSVHQGSIDWTKVKTDFAILRAGYGRVITQKDAQFENNYAGAKKAGIPVGVYWYSYAMTPEEARTEADVCLSVLAGKQFEYPIYFDIEEEKQLKLGKEKVSAIILAFLEKVEAAGYWVGLYMSASPLSDLVTASIRNRFAVWVANVGVQKPSYSGAYGMWQYSWNGRIAGISGDVDLDYAYADYPAMIKEKGLNGFGKPPEKPPEDPAEDSITVEMTVNGKKYSGTLKAI